MNKVILSLSLLACSTGAWADLSYQEELRLECAKVKNYAASGKKIYDQQQYQKAINAFKQQAAWAAFCQFNHEESGVSFSPQAISTAFNNVGLSYAKLGQNGWARAWFSVFPDMKSSQFNLKQLPVPKPSTNLVGEYVSYAGFGAWNTITVKQQKNAYYIEFNGLYMGPRSLIYGPNMGEFETHMPRQSKRALYRLEDCKIELKFGFDVKQGQYIQVDETKNTHCGFGHNVSSSGVYLRVMN
ncbi:hypothetical protein [Acinetobacter sp. ASP199]|uniref:hypothetical protein n=1 Tax=unclassified Acinetobacter TaxID=196816 RepID=UPI001F6047B1|nr:hypothetical protein [Acinetobacter sp. ASP199]UNT59354.1 hypothetical protein IHE35_00480 [Acinetobacter sp. ASP199]